MQQNSQKALARDPASSPASLAQAAIVAALAARWQEAVKLNEQIIANQKDNTEALNRLARAHYFLGETQKAQKFYKQVLALDPYNVIALKNLDKINKVFLRIEKTTNTNGSPHQSGNGKLHYIPTTTNLSQIFLYEPGKTKVVNLLNLAPPSVLATLSCGDQVFLNPKNHALTVANLEGIYLGAFPDDFAHRLLSFIAGGNQYETFVKCATLKMLAIFIKETKRGAKFAAQPSFQSKNTSFFDEEA